MITNNAPPEVLRGIHQVIGYFAQHGIGKNRRNEQQGFAFRGIDDVMNRMAESLVAANLVIIPNIKSREVTERATSRGNPLFYVSIEVEYKVYSTIDGSFITCVVPGEAMDSGDKATNKALSIAYKYMAFQLFAIPTNEDPDATTHTLAPKEKAVAKEVEFVTVDEIQIISGLIAQAELDPVVLLQAYTVSEIGQLPRARCKDIIARLQKKILDNPKESA